MSKEVRMRFYTECVRVAESVGALMSEEQCAHFAECESKRLPEYQWTLGMWIRNHLLPHNTYLRAALNVLGFATPDDMSLFLIEFAQQYWKLKRIGMM